MMTTFAKAAYQANGTPSPFADSSQLRWYSQEKRTYEGIISDKIKLFFAQLGKGAIFGAAN